MANISKIKIINGSEYNLVDANAARAEDLGGLSFSLSAADALLVTHESNTITAATDTTLEDISDAIGTLAEAWQVAASSAEEDDDDSSAANVTSGVRFIDYDGTLVDAYPTAKALTLTSLPDNPDHDGLTAQGWNWSLANIQSYLTKHPDAIVNVGQMYVTDDGKTRVYIHLGDERHAPMLGVCPNGTVDVDWGDGTTHDTLTGTSVTAVKWTPTHNYASGGDYVIKLTVTGSMGFYGSTASNAYSYLLRCLSSSDVRNEYYIRTINKVEIGSNVTHIGECSFFACNSMTCLTIPNSVTLIGAYAFQECYSVVSLTIPDGITNIGNYTFSHCSSIRSVMLPNSVTSIGNYVFRNCRALTSITIPDGIMSIGIYAISECYNITNFIIPDGITGIGGSMFSYCKRIVSLIIPENVTSVGTQAFSYCYGMAEYHFLPTTPPTLSNTNAFTGIPADCIIYVPQGCLEAYQTAENWSTYADYMQEEPS